MIMAINAAASANDKATIIAVNIFDDAEGFRPKELMLAYALAAKTAQGPKIQAINISVSAKLRSTLSLNFLCNYCYLIIFYFNDASLNRVHLSINFNMACTGSPAPE